MIGTGNVDAKKRALSKKGKMVTTRDINVILGSGAKKLQTTTTKTIEPKYIDKPGPPQPGKGPMITTHNIEQFAKKAPKPWKQLTDAEKKVVIKERTAKGMATKARKKEEALAKAEEEQDKGAFQVPEKFIEKKKE